MNRKLRIALHSMTFYRDFGFIYCLSKILEKLGCETIICSNTNYLSLPIKLWSPDLFFYVTVARTTNFINFYPTTFLALWNAESCFFDTITPLESEIISSETLYSKLNKIFVWGEKTKELILNYAIKNNFKWVTQDISKFNQKIIPIGHPRIELATLGLKEKTTKKIRIGFIGLCGGINNNKYSIPELLSWFENVEATKQLSSEFCFQIRYLETIFNLITSLGSQKYEFSLRPYYLEDLKSYQNIGLVKNNVLQIDNSIEFTSWVNHLDIVIGAVSTTQYLAIAANKTFISLDRMLNRPPERVPYASTYLSAIPNNCPKNFDELIYMIENYERFRLNFDSNEVISNQYKNFLSNPTQRSTLITMASEILNTAREHQQNHKYPNYLCKFLNNAFIKYAELRTINLKDSDYSHFNSSIFKKAEVEFKPILEKLYKEIPQC